MDVGLLVRVQRLTVARECTEASQLLMTGAGECTIKVTSYFDLFIFFD